MNEHLKFIAPGYVRNSKSGALYFGASAIRDALIFINSDERTSHFNLSSGDGPAYLIGKLCEMATLAKRAAECDEDTDPACGFDEQLRFDNPVR